jgi:hypothetical protein
MSIIDLNAIFQKMKLQSKLLSETTELTDISIGTPAEVIARIDLVEKFNLSQPVVDKMTTSEVLSEYSRFSNVKKLDIDFDEILLEWSWRCDKGYPVWGDEKDMKILKELLDEKSLQLRSNKLTEAHIEDFSIPTKFQEKLNQANKMNQFISFIENLPGGESKPVLEDFFNRLSVSDYDELIKSLYSKTSVEDISKSDYDTGPAGKLFALEPKGIGKAELFLSWIIANSKVSGGSESFDLRINNKKYEIKDYRRGESKGIRLGTKGKVTRFLFWQEILKTLDVIDNLFATGGIEYITDSSVKDLLDVINKRADFITAGELNKTDIANLKSLYTKLNKISQSDAIGYTYVTFRGPNIEPISYTIKEIPSNLDSTVTIDLLSRGISESLSVQLRKLKYVRNPEAIEIDIQTAVDTAVDPEIPFIIFRPNGPRISTSFELSFISQGTIYIIEKK